MHVYLPIAEMSVNVFAILGLGGAAGLLAGMFGVGGGFLLTPLLIFIGVSPSVAVATSANQIIASSVSGFVSHWRRKNVDFKMGIYLLTGGFAGSTLGVALFRWLKDIGHVDLIISLCYVTFLGLIGMLMAQDSYRAYRKLPPREPVSSRMSFLNSLPYPVHFPASKLTISAVIPLTIGLFVGVMVSLMGIGGGFFLVPAMIYLLGMPTTMVIGTSLFQIIFITAHVTLLQAITTQTVDIMLALLLLSGSVFGAQAGIRLGSKIHGNVLRAMLAALVLGIAIKLALGLFATPDNVYSVSLLDD
jgi:uncharacterized membrane protein YfcA